MKAILATCVFAGGAAIAITLAASGPSFDTPGNEISGSYNGIEEYGHRLIEETPEYIGPDVADAKMRYAGNRLACGSCHLGAGVDPGTLSLATAITRYPRKSPRSGGEETIEDRIDGCMMRSMAGKALPHYGLEMRSMVAYLKVLAERDAATSKSQKQAHESPAFKTPNRAANLAHGEEVFRERCAACHQDDGLGLPASSDPREGYVFPPLWGPYSFNNGAGMHRVITAARFIKARMPLGKADLSDDDAFDVAAFVNSKPRPEMARLDADYPDKTQKPVDAGFPPFADPFPLDQHRFGPFQPIEAYYKNLKGK